MRESLFRISSLLWANILVAYALFVMQNYLTDVWKLSFTHAAAILNFWNGIYRILPVFFLYLVDSFLGNFKLLVFTSISYSAGILLLFLSTPPILADSTHTCKEYEPQCIGHTQKSLLYASLVLIAVGVAGNRVCVEPFLEEQREKTAPNSSPRRGEFYQALCLILGVIVTIVGALALPYIKPWTLRFGIPAICTVLGTVWFLSGWCSYKKDPPKGSSLCNVVRVLVAALLKIFQSYPEDDRRYYYKIKQAKFSPTSCLTVLHKAAIILPGEEDGNINRWKLCTVTEVEDAKVFVRMVPIWMSFLVCGIVSSVGDTYFVEQARKLNHSIGKLKLPIQVLLLVKKWIGSYLGEKIIRLLYRIRRRGAMPFGIALGMICSILCCISAAGIERMRLKVVRSHNLLDKADDDAPMSMYWLIFQFVLLGGFDSILDNGMRAYYGDRSPESMQGYLENFTRGVLGLGFMCSPLFVYVVGRISEKGGKPNWFQETLNMSRLDRYYWVLAALSSVNLFVFVFVFVASRYKHQRPVVQGECDVGIGYTDMWKD